MNSRSIIDSEISAEEFLKRNPSFKHGLTAEQAYEKCEEGRMHDPGWAVPPYMVKAMASDPEYAYKYAYSTDCPFPQGEEAIATHSYWSYLYARFILRDRFRLGEKVISSNPINAARYAIHVIGRKFPEGEEAIATHPNAAFEYASYALSARFPEGEKAISSNVDLWKVYSRRFLK